MKKHTLDVDTLRRINKLCELGARPPVIKALLPNANPMLIRSQWEEIQEAAPPKGRLPMLVEWFFSNYQIKLHSSFIAAIWRRSAAGKVHFVDAYIASYEQYLQTFPSPLLTFDRAWYLIRTLSTDMTKTTVCPECDTEYIQNPDELVNHKTCPCCRIFNLRQLNDQTTKDLDGRPEAANRLSRPLVTVKILEEEDSQSLHDVGKQIPYFKRTPLSLKIEPNPSP